MVLTWHAPGTAAGLSTSGPEYLLRMARRGQGAKKVPWYERKHPLTGFQRRAGSADLLVRAPERVCDPYWEGHVFFVHGGVLCKNLERTSEQPPPLQPPPPPLQQAWSGGCVARIHHGERSHTRAIAEAATDPLLRVCGPFEGSMSADIERQLRQAEQVVVAAGGSGAGYLLDCMQNHAAYGACPALFLFTTADVGLFQWFTWMAQTLQERAAAAGGDVARRAGRGLLVAGLTAKGVAISEACMDLANGRVALGRLQFTELLAPFRAVPCHAFVQGSVPIQRALREACVEHGCRLSSGASYDNVGTAPRETLFRELKARVTAFGAAARRQPWSRVGVLGALDALDGSTEEEGPSAEQVLRAADAVGVGAIPTRFITSMRVKAELQSDRQGDAGGGCGGGGGGGGGSKALHRASIMHYNEAREELRRRAMDIYFKGAASGNSGHTLKHKKARAGRISSSSSATGGEVELTAQVHNPLPATTPNPATADTL